jgi:vacuolar-type H+-ATPase subunit C/Vma6
MSSATAFLNARARALIGTVMPTPDILRLAELPTVEAITRELETTGYFRHKPGGEERFSPIQRLWNQLDEDYRAAITVVNGAGRGVLRALYGEREAAFIKATLGCVYRGIPPADRCRYTGGLHLLDRSKEADLLEATDLAEAVERTPQRYRATVQNALHRVEEEGSLFPMEIGLDLFVLHEMWLAMRSLSRADRIHVGALVGAQFDVYNVTAACRLREIFHVPSDETLGYLIHHGLYLFLSHRRALAGAESLAQIVAVVTKTPYEAFLRDARTVADMERGMLRAFHHLLDVHLGGSPFHLGSTVAYLFLKATEIRNLTHVYEARRQDVKDISLRDMML